MEKGKWYKVGRAILDSAPFALLLSLILFGVEVYNSKQDNDHVITEFNKMEDETRAVINNLKLIEQSLTTRYIGIFPDFMEQINQKILPDTLSEGADIIIFEDILFYGAMSDPEQFARMTDQLIYFSHKGYDVTVAFYENQGEGINTHMFRSTMLSWWIDQNDINKVYAQYDSLAKDINQQLNNEKIEVDSIRKPIFRERFTAAKAKITQSYFEKNRDANYDAFKKSIDAARNEIPKEAPIYKSINELKRKYLGEEKKYKDITYKDLECLYNEMTNVLRQGLQQSGCTLLPLKSHLTMSCFSNGRNAIFALPSRFSSKEIGFETHDKQIIEYIRQMKDGIANEQNHSDEQKNN